MVRLRCLYGMWVRGEESPPVGADVERDENVLAAMYLPLRRLAAVAGSADLDPDDLVQEAVARALAVGPLSLMRNPRAYLSTAIVRIAANDRRSWGRRQQAVRRAGPGDCAVPAEYPSDVALLGGCRPSSAR